MGRPLLSDEKTYGITNAFKYHFTAGFNTPETHLVAATLISFSNWEDCGIYRGLKEKSSYMGEHEVLMLDNMKFEGKRVVRCKTSNGVLIWNKRYAYVSPEIMVIVDL